MNDVRMYLGFRNEELRDEGLPIGSGLPDAA